LIVPLGAWTPSEMVNVQLDQVYFEDISTGGVSEITSSWNNNHCATKAYIPSTLSALQQPSTCSYSSTTTKTEFLASSARLFCLGMVKSVDYTVTHDTTAEAAVTSVVATVLLTDIPMNTMSNESTQFHQSYGIKFNSVNANGLSTNNGNLVKRLVFCLVALFFCICYFHHFIL
jgi:hypothetical protein